MASPSARPASTTSRPSRRRQRSTRILIACALVVVAAVVVVAAALVGSLALAVVAGVVATALGAAGIRITYAEVVASRRDAARDRAEQAQAYLVVAQERSSEQALYVADTSGRIARHEATISRLESRLGAAATELDQARQEIDRARQAMDRARQEIDAERESARLVTADRDRLARGREDAEERAALAIVRVAELEQEIDIVLAEWRAGQSAPRRKHA